MGIETMMALLTVISLLAAGTTWVFAWKINHQWSDFIDKQNEDWAKLCTRLNDEWFKLYQTISEKNATENRESE
ncbi:MAG: hypothetical protein J6N51_10955 [Selenomonas sp.]|nr:hypothetical protein [Selenomonas sp.]